MRTCVYVDGFNLYYAIRNLGAKWLDLRAYSSALLPAPHTVVRIKYFTARVSGASDPGAPGRQQIYLNALKSLPELETHFGSFLAKNQWRPVVKLPAADRLLTWATGNATMCEGNATVAIDALLSSSRLETLAIGKYPTRGQRPSHPMKPAPAALKALTFAMEEKGSDVNLAAHLLNDAWAGTFDAAAVVSNDTDLVEPIRMVAQERGKPVVLICPHAKGAAQKLVDVATSVRHTSIAHLRASQFPNPVVLPDGRTILRPTTW